MAGFAATEKLLLSDVLGRSVQRSVGGNRYTKERRHIPVLWLAMVKLCHSC